MKMNAEANRQLRLRYRNRNRHFANAYKEFMGCADCGNADYRVLDFHHLRDKKLIVSWVVNRGHSILAIVREVAKCVVLCANCHRIREREKIDVHCITDRPTTQTSA